jgi:hypothetical protein
VAVPAAAAAAALPGNTWRGVLEALRSHASCRRLRMVQTGVFARYKNFNKVRCSSPQASLCWSAGCSQFNCGCSYSLCNMQLVASVLLLRLPRRSFSQSYSVLHIVLAVTV